MVRYVPRRVDEVLLGENLLEVSPQQRQVLQGCRSKPLCLELLVARRLPDPPALDYVFDGHRETR